MRVRSLHIYPVKGCRGISLQEAEVNAWGFVGDRRHVIVTTEGQFLTQRQLPQLALIETEWKNNALTLASPNHGSVTVGEGITGNGEGRTLRVTIWKDSVVADDCGDEAAEWLTRRMGQPLRLARAGRDYVRPVKPSKAKPGDVVSFADAYPFLLMTEASVADLNDRIQENDGAPVPMDRFRPNIVIADGTPLAEDAWTCFRIGEVNFRNAGPCARCIVTTTNQQTAERGKEPLRTLATYRRDAKEPTDVNFGINLIHENKTGRVRVGDLVEGNRAR